MNEPKEGTLEVLGASLYYKVRGTGPLLLILQGGAGDADGSDALSKHLLETYTVVTYDRRGLSRSKAKDLAAAVGIEKHSEDACDLLAALSNEPVRVAGFSIGAVIGLDLAARHAERVHTLLAHEPALEELLPDEERARAMQIHEEVTQIFRREGVAAAMKKMAAISGVNFSDREPDVELPRPDSQGAARMAANMSFFLSNDAPAAHRYKLDVAALKAAPTRIVPASGRTSGETLPRHSALALAERLGTPVAEFPGGHSGYVLRPREFASRLREVLGA